MINREFAAILEECAYRGVSFCNGSAGTLEYRIPYYRPDDYVVDIHTDGASAWAHPPGHPEFRMRVPLTFVGDKFVDGQALASAEIMLQRICWQIECAVREGRKEDLIRAWGAQE